MPGSYKWSVILRFPHPNPIYTSLLPIRATFPAHLILRSDQPNSYLCLCILSHGVRETSVCLCWTYDAGASGSHSECTVFTVTPSTGTDFHWHVTEITYDTG
jgi:hypothetical protein